MAKFGQRSMREITTCDERLQAVAFQAIQHPPQDFMITCGHRGQEAQELACAQGTSKAHWPDSRHNKVPAQAFDFAPVLFKDGKLTIDWNDLDSFERVAKHILATASKLGIELEWGGNWKFLDLPHIQLPEVTDA